MKSAATILCGKAADLQLPLVRLQRFEVSSDARVCLGQKGVQAFRQPVIEKEDFWLERSGGVNANIKMAVLFSGFSERGKEEHTGGEKEVQGVDCCQ